MAENLLYAPPSPHGTDILLPTVLRDGAISICESGNPRDGYPPLQMGGPHSRLFWTPEQTIAASSCEEVYQRSDGTLTKITRVILPPGHDTNSQSRASFLSSQANVDNLLSPPIPDIQTGSDCRVDDFEPGAFQRFLDAGHTVFDQHDRPLPGSFERVTQLFGLRTRGISGEPVGMPLGNGTFSSPGNHPAADGFPLMPITPGSTELAMPFYGRPPTDQSVAVWAPPGGFGNRADVVDGRYSSWQSVVRLCALPFKAGIDVSPFVHMPVHTEFALSSPTTAHAGLIAESHLVVVPHTQEFARQVLYEIPDGHVEGVHWLAVSALVKANSELRRRAAIDPAHEGPNQIVWSTHMRGLVAAVNAYRRWTHK